MARDCQTKGPRASRPHRIYPRLEALEDRRLLSHLLVVRTGRDHDGTVWRLALSGPGDLEVTKVGGAPLDSLTDISQIILKGTGKLSQLIGTVSGGTMPGTRFTVLTEDSRSHGPALVSLPGFSLARTDPKLAPTVNLPGGIAVLRLNSIEPGGGTDTIGVGTVTRGTVIELGDVRPGPADRVLITVIPAPPVVPFLGASPVSVGLKDLIIRSVDAGGPARTGTTELTTKGDVGRIWVQGDATNFSVTARSIAAFRILGHDTGQPFPGRKPVTGVTTSEGLRFFAAGGPVEDLGFTIGAGIQVFATGTNVTRTSIAARHIIHAVIGGEFDRSRLDASTTFQSVRFNGGAVRSEVLAEAMPAPAGLQWEPDSGVLRARVRGDLVDSVIAASYDPGPDQTFGTPDDLPLHGGFIRPSITGAIVNHPRVPTFFGQFEGAGFFARVVRPVRAGRPERGP